MLVSGSDGHDYVIGGEKSGMVHAVDPDTGKVAWTNKVGAGGIMAGVHWGLAAGTDTVYVPISDIDDGRKLNEPRRPGLYALKLATGEFIWKAPLKDECAGKPRCRVGNTAAIAATSSLVAAGGADGILRLHDAKTGAVLKQFDTTPEIKTVSGAMGHGGSMSGASAPIFDGQQLFVNSGYGFAALMPGNLLLVYELKK